jgi:hypothetical protein
MENKKTLKGKFNVYYTKTEVNLYNDQFGANQKIFLYKQFQNEFIIKKYEVNPKWIHRISQYNSFIYSCETLAYLFI